MAKEKDKKTKSSSPGTVVFILLLVAVSFVAGSLWTKSKDKGEEVMGAVQEQEIEEEKGEDQGLIAEEKEFRRILDKLVAGDYQVGQSEVETSNPFKVEDDREVCLQDEKPIVRLFSTTGCGHCTWVGDTFDKVVKEYVEKGEIVAYHWNFDTRDDILTEKEEGTISDKEVEIFSEFSNGGVPTFVFGCKYYRLGNSFEHLINQ